MHRAEYFPQHRLHIWTHEPRKNELSSPQISCRHILDSATNAHMKTETPVVQTPVTITKTTEIFFRRKRLPRHGVTHYNQGVTLGLPTQPSSKPGTTPAFPGLPIQPDSNLVPLLPSLVCQHNQVSTWSTNTTK